MTTRTLTSLLLAGGLLSACSENELHKQDDVTGGEGPQILVEPEVLDFGRLGANDEPEVRSFTITSVGSSPLSLQDVSLIGDYASFQVLTDVAWEVLEPGDSLSVDVAFHPWGNEELAQAIVHSNDPDVPRWPVELLGAADVPELQVSPDPLDHGNIGVGCGRDNVATLTSVGAYDITVSEIGVQGDGFTLNNLPTLPITLAPGESTTVGVNFTPTASDAYSGSLVVTSDEAMGVREAIQIGTGVTGDAMSDRWDIPPGDPPSDIVFAVDASCSMNEDLWSLASNFRTFISQLETHSNDWRIIVASGDDGCSQSGILTPNTANYEDTFNNSILFGGFFSDYTEALLTINKNTIENTDSNECNGSFMRPNALLHIIDVSDEPEQSADMGALPWDQNVQAIWDKKGSPAMVRISAIAGPVPDGCSSASPGTGYAEAVAATGGVFLNICDNWATSANLALLAQASVNQSTFELSGQAEEASIVVTVNGSTRSDWTFDANRNVVVFNGNFPAGGDRVEISYSGVAGCD